MISEKCRQIAESPWFRHSIMGVIILAGILIGLETSRKIMKEYGEIIYALDSLILAIFVVEMVIRITAFGRKPHRFFLEPWNVFDFVIVAVCLLPAETGFVAVVRLARILRVLRLVSIMPRLQFLVGALLKSVPSIGYITLLLSLFFYIYACLGVFLFRYNDPIHFGTLGASLLTLFEVVTLEGWNNIFHVQLYGSHVFNFEGIEIIGEAPQAFPVIAPLYFISFILVCTMIILNLFIGVILKGMEEMQNEDMARDMKQLEEQGGRNTAQEVEVIISALHDLERRLKGVQHLLATGKDR